MAAPAAPRGLVPSRPAIEGFFSGLAKASAATALALVATTAFAKPDLTGVQLPPGFHIEVWTDQVPNARQMAFGDKGTVFVGSMRIGGGASKVYYIRTVNGKPVVKTLLTGLNNPNGVAFRNGLARRCLGSVASEPQVPYLGEKSEGLLGGHASATVPVLSVVPSE